MSTDQLEQRLAAIELTLASVQREVQALRAEPGHTGRWWEQLGPPIPKSEEALLDEMLAYGQYFRKTGKEPPENWKPGDPIGDTEITE